MAEKNINGNQVLDAEKEIIQKIKTMKESVLHKQICSYIKLQYPDVIFNTDLSGIKLTIGQAKKLKSLRSSRAMPDIVIYEPRGKMHGLFLEVKKETPYKKNGELKSNEHLKEQAGMMLSLRQRNYEAFFVWTFENAKNIIDTYLKLIVEC